MSTMWVDVTPNRTLMEERVVKVLVLKHLEKPDLDEVTISPAEIAGLAEVSLNGTYRHMPALSDNLANKEAVLETIAGRKNHSCGKPSRVVYNGSDIKIVMGPQYREYIVNLAGSRSPEKIKQMMKARSKHSHRLYWRLVSPLGALVRQAKIEYADLLRITGSQGKYPRRAQKTENIIEPAIRELNELAFSSPVIFDSESSHEYVLFDDENQGTGE